MLALVDTDARRWEPKRLRPGRSPSWPPRATPDHGTGTHPSGIGRTVTPQRHNHLPRRTEPCPDNHQREDEDPG